MTNLMFGHALFCCLAGDLTAVPPFEAQRKIVLTVFIVLVGGVLAELLSLVKSGIFRNCTHFVAHKG